MNADDSRELHRAEDLERRNVSYVAQLLVQCRRDGDEVMAEVNMGALERFVDRLTAAEAATEAALVECGLRSKVSP